MLSGQDNWKNLLDPLDIDLRRYIIHYGEMAQATYDSFNAEKASKYTGDSRYARKKLFSRVGLAKASPFKYKATKYFYATSQIPVPESFILKSLSTESLHKESNWIGYIAVANDEGKALLGRRDIVIAWRGTIQAYEWINDFDFPLVSSSPIFGEATNAQVHRGWLSIYTSSDPRSAYDVTSAREQVSAEVKRLVEKFKGEEISITITGHILGASLGTLSAADIVVNGLNKPKNEPDKHCPVTAFCFASPLVGDISFRKILASREGLHILRVNNEPDIVPHYPMIKGYTAIGEELVINTHESEYLKFPGDLRSCHNLEAYLHGVAGTQGKKGGFHLEVKRDIALVNKGLVAVKDEYLMPVSWWCMHNKGMMALGR